MIGHANSPSKGKFRSKGPAQIWDQEIKHVHKWPQIPPGLNLDVPKNVFQILH